MASANDGSGTSRILTLVFTDLADSTTLKTLRGDQAVVELRTAQQLEGSGNTEIEGALGRAYSDAGNRTEATKVLDHLRERARKEFVAPPYLATILIGLGRLDEALAELTKAVEERSYYVMYWKVDPDLDPLRSDPRFTTLLKKVGLEP